MRNNCSCEKYWGLLNDYADHRLSGRKREKVEYHLLFCTECKERLAGIREVKSAIISSPVPGSTDDFWANCYDKVLESQKPKVRTRRRLWKPVVGLSLAASCIGVVLLLTGLGRIVENSEIPDSDYMMQHASFASTQPLATRTHHVLLAEQCIEHSSEDNPSDPANGLKDPDEN